MFYDLPSLRGVSFSHLPVLGVLASALVLGIAACDAGPAPASGLTPTPQTPTPASDLSDPSRFATHADDEGQGQEPAGQEIIAHARAALEAVDSYHFEVEFIGWRDDSDEIRSEGHGRAEGEWRAPGDFRMESTIVPRNDGQGAITSQVISKDGRHYELLQQDDGAWQEIPHRPPGAPPKDLVADIAQWTLVNADAILRDTAVYHLRGTWTEVLAIDENVVTIEQTHNLYISHVTLRPQRLEIVITTEEAAGSASSSYIFDFFGYDGPGSIELPEHRVDLPEGQRPAAQPTRTPLQTPGIDDNPFEGEAWPPFMMIYELKRWPSTTHILYWRSDHDWRDEVIEGPGPQEERVGSWREFRDGRYTEFDATLGHTRRSEPEGIAPAPVSQVMQQIMLYTMQQNGIGPQPTTHEDTEVCHLDRCSTSVAAVTLGDDFPGVFTPDGIPLDTPRMRVLFLHLPEQGR